MDDGYLWGPPSVLPPALQKFSFDIMEHCTLELEVSKSECFTWSSQLPEGAPPGLKQAGRVVEGRWEPGWLVYGVPCGSDQYVAAMLDIKVDEVARGAARACEVLQGESQALWSVLRLSLQQQFGYWISLVHPTQVEEAATRVDNIMLRVLQQVGGFEIPQGGEGLPYTCPVGPELGGAPSSPSWPACRSNSAASWT